MIGAVIFDMDGVILNSVDMHLQVWNNVMKEYQLEISKELINKLNGMNTLNIAEYLVKEYGLDADPGEIALQKRSLSKEKVKEGVPLFEGVHETISVLKKLGYKIGLATMSTRENMEYALGNNLFDLEFDFVVTDDDVKRSKPAPDIFLRCAKGLGKEPNECVVVEDALNGIEAARSAGMYAVAVTTTTSGEHFNNAHAIMEKTSYLSADLIKALESKVEAKNEH